MINDRVNIGDGYNWKRDASKHIMAYTPQLDQSGHMIVTPDGSAVMLKAGGVILGSTGVIKSTPVNVHRTYLHNSSEYKTAGFANDMIQMVAIMLDDYQKEAWFPIDNIRIFGTNV
jgi:hypothetical protein